MTVISRTWPAVVAIALCLVPIAATRSGVALAADDTCAAAGAPEYIAAPEVLTGPAGADLVVDVDPAAGCPVVDALQQLLVKTYGADGSLEAATNHTNVPAPGGVTAALPLGQLPRGRRVEVQALVRGGAPIHAVSLRAETTSRLRPDLVVEGVFAVPQTLAGRAVDVTVVIAERNGDTGADATVALTWGQPTGIEAPATVVAGGRRAIVFDDVTLVAPVLTELSVEVKNASPAETDTGNNGGRTAVDVTEHELARSDVLVTALGGYGVQFNQHVYAPVTNLDAAVFPELEEVVKALGPQFVRIFYNENWEEDTTSPRYDPANMPSFIRSVELAQAAGATINITYHSATDARLRPDEHMARFAAVLDDLVRTRGLTNVRWVTIQNEPNTPGLLITLDQWQQLYRKLDAELAGRGLRSHVRIMGGDLVESAGTRDHEIWFRYMTANMADIVDAYSEHVYWQYNDTRRFEFRLRDIRKLVVDDNPVETRRPAYITEFAVRGNGVASAFLPDGAELRRTNLAAFQQLWFNIASAQLGFTGTSKWDLYWGRYDLTANNQSYWMVDPVSGGWRVFPAYHALRLLLQTTERGWQVIRTEPWAADDWDPQQHDTPEKELASYLAPDGKMTVIGLHSAGRLLTGSSDQVPEYSIGGLEPSTRFSLLVWNAAGDGETTVSAVTTTNAGVARFSVPLHAAFSLTTVPVES